MRSRRVAGLEEKWEGVGLYRKRVGVGIDEKRVE
jgi:hypothetical protein